MSARISGVVCVAVGLALAGARADDKPFLHRVFGDNAVLQRDIELPVWGWTAPGAAVKRTVVVLANVAPSVVAEERSISTS